MSHPVDERNPLFLCFELGILLDSELILVVVAEESVDIEHVFEQDWEGLMLVGEANEDVLLILLRQLDQVLLQLLRLGLFETLRDGNEELLERHLLNIDAVNFKINDIESPEAWITWAW